MCGGGSCAAASPLGTYAPGRDCVDYMALPRSPELLVWGLGGLGFWFLEALGGRFISPPWL